MSIETSRDNDLHCSETVFFFILAVLLAFICLWEFSGEENVATNPVKLKAISHKDVMQRAALLVKAANDLPRRGDDFELCNSFSTFTAFMEQQETRIRLILMRNAGCPTRMPKVNSDVDEYLERIVMVNDHVVERAVRPFLNHLFVTYSALKVDLCEKPQKKYGFESSIDNSYNVFIPKLLNKHHALPRKETSGMVIIDEDMGSDGSKRYLFLAYYQILYIPCISYHTLYIPYLPRICLQDFLDISKTPLTMVKTVEDLRRLRDVLNSCVEFAVDLEHHDFRSYLGLTCLIQISTRTEDYIIDPFPIWNEMHILNEPFTDAKILKVFHGAEHDIEWLQRDFGIYVVNMFDTGRAMRQLEMQKFNLRYLVHHYCGILLNKKYQLSDWRVRPLDSDMITYARSDTHYLLYCCDRLREDLLKKGDSNQTLLRLVYSGSASICSRVYQKPSFDKDGFHGLERRFVNNRQEAAMQVLWHWRDRMAREEDESVQYILPNHMLIRISLPRELKGILHCCNPVPPLVRECVHELHKCPLDFSQTGFDEESGNQMSSSKVDDTSPVSERNPTHTLLSVLDSATVIGNNLNGDFGAYTVVDKVSHFLIVDINNKMRVAQWSEASCNILGIDSCAHWPPSLPSLLGRQIDLSGRIAALARWLDTSVGHHELL
uniref:HRDC domain-containing protein n=1 Tax=Angiostrongylus cantonensis TaxID=6313 RepID=A0A0K0D917_ANGCA